MALSVTDVGNPQGGKKSNDKNKDSAVLVDEWLAEITNAMATLMGRVDDMEKHLEELGSMGDFEELRGEVQAAIKSVVVNVNQEDQDLWASETTQKEELEACRAKVEVYKTRVEALEA